MPDELSSRSLAEAHSAQWSVRVPCDNAYRHGVSNLLEALCCGVPDVVRYHVVSALNEAFDNVVQHSRLDVTETIEVVAVRDATKIAVHLKDDGVAFCIAPPEEPDIGSLDEGGMGLMIMHRAMDEVRYEHGEGNILTLVKYLH